MGNVPVDPTPTPAPSSFYQSGTVYSTVQNIDADKAEIDADRVAAQAAADAAAASQYASASSASDAATSAANAATAVQLAAGTATPLVDGTAAVGTSTKWAHEDHVHPTDTSRASVTYVDAADALKADKTYVDAQDTAVASAASTALTAGLAPKADKTYVDTQDALKAPLASPAFTGTISFSGRAFAVNSGANGYTELFDGSANAALFLGGSTDPANYYRNTTHYIQSIAGGATFATFNASGLAVTGRVVATGTVAAGPAIGGAGDLSSVRSGSPGTGVVYLGNSGARYLHFDGTNYIMPSSHLYTAAGRVLGTSTDAGLVINGRLAYVTDIAYSATGGITEPYPGAVITGLGATSNVYAIVVVYGRYRYMQLQNLAGGWWTIGTA